MNFVELSRDDRLELGPILKERRKATGKSQEVLANEIGISNSHLSNIERGESPATLAVMNDICHALGTTREAVITDWGQRKLGNVVEAKPVGSPAGAPVVRLSATAGYEQAIQLPLAFARQESWRVASWPIGVDHSFLVELDSESYIPELQSGALLEIDTRNSFPKDGALVVALIILPTERVVVGRYHRQRRLINIELLGATNEIVEIDLERDRGQLLWVWRVNSVFTLSC